MRAIQLTLIIIIFFLDSRLRAQEEQTYALQDLQEIFSLFNFEDINFNGKQQIINNLIHCLELDKQSDIPADILISIKSDYSSFISSKKPVNFTFKYCYLAAQDLDAFLKEFNLEIRQLATVLKIKRMDGNTYLPLAALIITLSWDPKLHFFLQEKYAAFEKNKLTLTGGPYGEYAYCLSTLYGASTYILKYIIAFTDIHEHQQAEESKTSNILRFIARCLSRKTSDAEVPLISKS
ncbi:MAG: hypothetical protein AB8G05_00945 [Oligoflexales bacterium]